MADGENLYDVGRSAIASDVYVRNIGVSLHARFNTEAVEEQAAVVVLLLPRSPFVGVLEEKSLIWEEVGVGARVGLVVGDLDVGLVVGECDMGLVVGE